jgi:DNA-binding transcriptional regulator LsrR (DeoR family)
MMYKLYCDEGLTQREVGEELGVSRAKVQKTFKEMGWIGRFRNRRLDSSEVRNLYEDGLNQVEIAKRLGVSRTYVQKILKETNSSEFGSGLSRKKIKTDLERVRFLYCEKGLTQAEIADLLGIAQTTISRRV